MVAISREKTYAVSALIGMSFLLVGSEYITWWLYKLPLVFDSRATDMLSEGAGYLIQVLGMLGFALLVKKNVRTALSRTTFGVIVAANLAMSALAFFSQGAGGILLFGFLMNLFIGLLSAYYLTRLAQLAPQQNRALAFGLGYAFGSVGTWALSLPMGGTFLGSPWVFIFYAAMIMALLLIDRHCIATAVYDADDADSTSGGFDQSIIVLAAVLVVLLSIVRGMGFYFPTSDHLGGTVSAVAVRAFYAIGLIAAGLVNDKNRKWGAICCLAALVFPFITFALNGRPSAEAALWITSYIFFGFFSVYRAVTFTDLAGKQAGLLPLAGFGLMFGRMGDAAGALTSVALESRFPLLLIVSAVLFVAAILLFFMYYNKIYGAVLPPVENEESLLRGFANRFALSAREVEVLKLIIAGRSNSEIAADLYIAESTVKFHVKNILKKTSCANRTKLINEYKSGG